MELINIITVIVVFTVVFYYVFCGLNNIYERMHIAYVYDRDIPCSMRGFYNTFGMVVFLVLFLLTILLPLIVLAGLVNFVRQFN
jgi:flagellar biosynthesis protein FlhB